MSDVMQDRLTVTVNNQTYTFRIPSIKYDLEVGYKAGEIRRKAYPSEQGVLGTIDMQGVQFARYCAILELYLTSASTLWPYGYDDSDMAKVDPQKPPVVDFEKFPVRKSRLVFKVGEAFETEYARFCDEGDSDN